MKNFLKEFQAFISKGNVMDLAVAVIIGAAFSAIVNSLVKDVVNPILGFVAGKPDFTNLFLVLKAGATVLGYGAFLTAVVQFLLLAFVIFWLVRVVTTVRKHIEAQAARLLEDKKAQEAAKPAAPAPTPEDVALLREIRDLLKAQQNQNK